MNIEIVSYMISNVGPTMLPVDFFKTQSGKKATLKPGESLIVSKEEFDCETVRKLVKMGKLRERILKQAAKKS